MSSFDHTSVFHQGFLMEQKVVSSEADSGRAGGTALEHFGVLLEELEKVAGEEEPAALQQGAR